MRVTGLWLPSQECFSRRQCGGTEDHQVSASPRTIQVEGFRSGFGPRMNHEPRCGVSCRTHNYHRALRASAIKVILFAIADVEDGSLLRSFVLGQACEVSSTGVSAHSNKSTHSWPTLGNVGLQRHRYHCQSLQGQSRQS